jgi:hypothetical protein
MMPGASPRIYCLALQLTLPESQVSVTTPAASRSVALSDHLPVTFVRALLKAPLTEPSKSVVVPSSLRAVVGPKDAPNLRFFSPAAPCSRPAG